MPIRSHDGFPVDWDEIGAFFERPKFAVPTGLFGGSVLAAGLLLVQSFSAKMKLKCPICSAEKGRRVCRIRQQSSICSRCCAQIRNPDCSGCPHYSQAEAFAREKNLTSDTPHFTIRIDPKVDEAVFQALDLAEQGDFARAQELLVVLRDRNPDLHIVHFGIGTVLALQNAHEQAIIHFDKCLAIFPCHVEAWFNKAVAHKELLDLKNMVAACRKVILWGDKKDDFVVTAASILQNYSESIQKECAMSVAEFEQVMAGFEQAVMEMEEHNIEQALIGFQTVLKRHPKHLQSWGNLGLCHGLLGQKQEAMAALNKALEINPNYGPAQLNRVSVAELKEGERLPANQLQTVDYYKDCAKKGIFESRKTPSW